MAAQKLIDAGASLHVQATDGSTPLHLAVEENGDQMVGLLLRAGADVRFYINIFAGTKVHNTMTPSDSHKHDASAGGKVIEQKTSKARPFGNVHCLNMVRCRGDDSFIATPAFQIREAVWYANLDADVISCSIYQPNMKDHNGQTPLHHAVRNNNIPVAQVSHRAQKKMFEMF